MRYICMNLWPTSLYISPQFVATREVLSPNSLPLGRITRCSLPSPNWSPLCSYNLTKVHSFPDFTHPMQKGKDRDGS